MYHKVFHGIATRGKSTMGYFYGFKLHIVVNENGEIIDFQITQANVDDRTPLKGNLLKKIWGKLYADKGYVSKSLCEMVFSQGIRLITGVRKNMKNIYMIEHSRHRSFHNFISNVLAGIICLLFFT